MELHVGEVHTVNIDALFVPDVSHAQLIQAKIPGAKVGQKSVVTVSREIATRLLKLGIEDPAENFRGKLLRVSGMVEQIKRPSNPTAMVYGIQVTNLDQLESIRQPWWQRRNYNACPCFFEVHRLSDSLLSAVGSQATGPLR